jgi:hypothetical protein
MARRLLGPVRCRGRYVQHDVGRIALLDATPVHDRADVGGAAATPGSATLPAALFVTPWNLFESVVTMGRTLLAENATLETIVAADRDDPQATSTAAGCRLLYALLLEPSFTSLQVWHLDEGARVVDRELTRGQLLAGVTFEA